MRISTYLTLVCAITVGMLGVALYESMGSGQKFSLEHVIAPSAVSVELHIASGARTRELMVAQWLRDHRAPITADERRFGVDRRAIAGLIAYEGIVNVHLATYGNVARWAGPGKVHYKDTAFAEGMPASKEIELLGLLPRRTMEQRRRLLESPNWSIAYIAAIMHEDIKIVKAEAGGRIQCDPGALVTLASAWNIYEITKHLRLVKRRPYVLANNFPGNWVAAKVGYLQAAVGTPDSSLCGSKR